MFHSHIILRTSNKALTQYQVNQWDIKAYGEWNIPWSSHTKSVIQVTP